MLMVRASGRPRDFKASFSPDTRRTGQIETLLPSPHGPWDGLRVLVTAGGTREPIDPVRVLTNASSGKTGYAVARAAHESGAEVTLIAADGTETPVPRGAKAGVADAILDEVMRVRSGNEAGHGAPREHV